MGWRIVLTRMCIFPKLFAVEVIWGVFQVCWHWWAFPGGSSADVLHCSAVQVTLGLHGCGSIFKKIAQKLHTRINPSHFTSETAFMCRCILYCSNLLQFLCVREPIWFKCYHWRSTGIPCAGFCCQSWCGFYSDNSSVTPMNCPHTWKEKNPSKQLFSLIFLLDVGLAHLLCVRTHHQFLCWMAVSVGFYYILSQKGIADTLHLETCRSLNRSRNKYLSWVRGGNKKAF